MKQGPRFETLDEWLLWQEGLHYAEIDLGLERVKAVYQRLALPELATKVITVAGTNGKGSTVAMLEAIYIQSGYQVGSFSSPHLINYNERIKLQAKPVSDAALCAAFADIDEARNSLSLTYFEFNALAAFYTFAHAKLDVVILEVGLGGRLDATNIIDADVSVITSIGLDHQQWLGQSLAAIAREKAGIFRAGKPAVCAQAKSYDLLKGVASAVQCPVSCIGRDYDYHIESNHWWYSSLKKTYRNLPLPNLMGEHQLQNAAAAITVIEHLQTALAVNEAAICQGLKAVSIPGRFQTIAERPRIILDVAHNVDAARALCKQLDYMGVDQLLIVFGMLNDKEMDEIIEMLDRFVAHWFVATLDSQRSFPVKTIAQTIIKLNSEAKVSGFDDIISAYQAAIAQSNEESVLLVTGSFLSVAKVLALT